MSRGYRVDLHVKVLDDAVVERAKARGLDAIVYAPHFQRLPEIRAEAAKYGDDELLVVPGREVFAGSWRDRTHVLAVGLSEPVPDFITLPGAMEELVRQEAAILAPHPGFLTMSLGPDDVRRYRESFHAVEVYNPKYLPWHDRRATALADEVDLPVFGSSYAHLRSSVGEVWTTFEEPIPDEAGLVDTLTSGSPRRVERRHGVDHGLRRGAEIAHLVFENTWRKADRLLRSGVEATHPDHPAYRGRFDDVAVY